MFRNSATQVARVKSEKNACTDQMVPLLRREPSQLMKKWNRKFFYLKIILPTPIETIRINPRKIIYFGRCVGHLETHFVIDH